MEKKLAYLYRDVSEKINLTMIMQDMKRKGLLNKHANRQYKDMIYNGNCFEILPDPTKEVKKYNEDLSD